MVKRSARHQRTEELLDFQEKLKRLHEIVAVLSKAEPFDEFCRLVIELGRSLLGFDRLGMWLLSPDHRVITGTYGTDENGQIRDERGQSHTLVPGQVSDEMLKPGQRWTFWRNISLMNDKTEVVGVGDIVRGNLWDGEQILGWLNGDNLLRKEPWTEYQFELLGLYAASIGHLITRKRIEKEIRAKEEEARVFQGKLKALHEVTSELSQASSFDELCRRAVELGCSRLGFDRLGLWFFDTDPNFMLGSFGIDETGQIRDERHQRLPVSKGEFVQELLAGRVFAPTRDDVPLYNDRHEVVGTGWKVVAQMWDRDRNVGWISIDNLLSHKPLWDYDLELLSLYADTLGHLTTVRRTEDALVAERTLLRTIIDTVPDPIYVKDTESRFILTNKACWEDTPNTYSESDLIGKTDFDIFPHDIAQDHIIDDRQVMKSGVPIVRLEEPGRPQGEQPTTLLTTKVPLRDIHQRIIGLVGVSHDITELKRIERQTLELAVERERVNVLRESITSISHDLRTPLTTIKSLLYLLEHLTDPAQQKDKLQGIKYQTEVLEHRIRELLYSARLENVATIARNSVNLNTLVANAAQNFRSMAENRALALTVDLQADLPDILGNERELERVLDNLIQNAITYTPGGGSIVLKTSVWKRNVVVEITDTGVGINESHLPHIFDHFYRVDKSRSMNQDGMGLGLAIVKRIVQIHGGNIEVESSVGQGSVFRVLLPVIDGDGAKGDSP